jgi:hypothetical protein
MEMTKTSDQSHLISCSDMMSTFITKEGANSYPTSIVLLNRFFSSTEDYTWRKNSDITADLPNFKVGDDVHWYKLSDIYTNLKNALISESLFSQVKVFKNDNLPSPNQSDLAFRTKNRYYIYNRSTSQMFWSSDFNVEGFDRFTNTTEVGPILNVLDMLSVDNCDYLLCTDSIYKFKPDGTCIKALTAPAGVVFNAFETGSDKLVIATNNGAYVYTGLTEFENLNLVVNIKYKTVVGYKTVITTSGSGESQSSSVAVNVPNGIPTDNNCTFVWVVDRTMYVGNNKTSCILPIDGPYEYVPSSTHIENPSMNPGKSVSSTNRHHGGINGISTSSISLDGLSINPISSVSGYEYDGKIYEGVSSVTSIFKTEKLTYISTDVTENNEKSGIYVFLNSNTAKRLTVFNMSNYVRQPRFVCLKDNDLWFLNGTDKTWYRSYKPKDNDITFGFILFNFEFEADASKDTIDCCLANVSLDELLSLSYSNSVFNKYFANAKNGTTKFLIAFSKTGSKTIFNIFGNDNRRAKAVEMKQCCNAFDIGEDED